MASLTTLDIPWFPTISLATYVEGQPGFGFCVAAVDQACRDANDVSSNCPTSGLDKVRVELEGGDEGGNVRGSQPTPLGFVDRNVGEDYDDPVEVAQGDGGRGGRCESDDCESADFGVTTDWFGGVKMDQLDRRSCLFSVSRASARTW